MLTDGWVCRQGTGTSMLTDGWVCQVTLAVVIDADDILVWGCIQPANSVGGAVVEDVSFALLTGTSAVGVVTGDMVDGLINTSGVFGSMHSNTSIGDVTVDAPSGSLTGDKTSGGATNSPDQDGAAARILPSGSVAPAGVTALIPKATNNGDCN